MCVLRIGFESRAFTCSSVTDSKRIFSEHDGLWAEHHLPCPIRAGALFNDEGEAYLPESEAEALCADEPNCAGYAQPRWASAHISTYVNAVETAKCSK